MSKPGIVPSSSMRRKPMTRSISQRSAVTHIAGVEQSYPTYRFSGRIFLERPNHNPFSDFASLNPQVIQLGLAVETDVAFAMEIPAFDSGFDEGFS